VSRDEAKAGAGPLESLSGLDRLLEHRVRLAVCVLLSRSDQVSFSRLLGLTGETNGNLGANLRRLEEAGYITVRKEFADRRPVSWYRLTRQGRSALKGHIAALDTLLHPSAGD